MERDQHRHPLSAEPLVDRHSVTSGNRECDSLRITVEQVHITRSTGECARRVNPVADVLHAFRSAARDDFSRRLVVEPKGWNSGVLTMKYSGLAIRRRRRQSAEPPADVEVTVPKQLVDRRAVTPLYRAPQVGVGERID